MKLFTALFVISSMAFAEDIKNKKEVVTLEKHSYVVTNKTIIIPSVVIGVFNTKTKDFSIRGINTGEMKLIHAPRCVCNEGK
jgi:hypothetical protein